MSNQDQDLPAQSSAIVEKLIGKAVALHPSGKMPRFLHAKGRGKQVATLTVLPNLPSMLRAGIFVEGATYPVVARFSNGSSLIQDDAKPDVRGVAIKVFGVDKNNPALTQDFLMGNHPAFFIRNGQDLLEFVSAHSTPALGFFFPGLNPFSWRLRELKNMVSCVRRNVTNPLGEQYWSQAPYRLGIQVVKLSLRPRGVVTATGSGPDFLREAMAKHLAHNAAYFDLMVQVRTVGSKMPLNDPTVIWDENLSPFIPVARLEFPPQSFNSPEQDAEVEAMRFSPGNTLPAHAPVGEINLVRQPVYKTLWQIRTERNS